LENALRSNRDHDNRSPGRPALSGYIIGTEFERMRDTCINFTGRLIKLVPLRF